MTGIAVGTVGASLGPRRRARRWYPFVSFWQATADMAAAYQVPAGHGHRYSDELVDAWRMLLTPADVSSVAPSQSLATIRTAVLRLGQGG